MFLIILISEGKDNGLRWHDRGYDCLTGRSSPEMPSLWMSQSESRGETTLI